MPCNTAMDAGELSTAAEAFNGGRQAMLPNLPQEHPAARYRI